MSNAVGPWLRAYYGGERAPDTVVMLGAFCPACKCEHGFRVDAVYWEDQGLAVWTWDGNEQTPTFVGSMLANARQHPGRPLCHSFVENGQWRFLDDSTHDLAGQTVPMVPYPEGYGSGHHA
ncbi:MAG: DUF6527 family protein [Chloroflexi bacterium]|nr:DUF6527 family protein [Chloroflexota bacterium]